MRQVGRRGRDKVKDDMGQKEKKGFRYSRRRQIGDMDTYRRHGRMSLEELKTEKYVDATTISLFPRR